VSNSFGTVGHIYALKILRGPDNFAHDTINIFIYHSFIARLNHNFSGLNQDKFKTMNEIT